MQAHMGDHPSAIFRNGGLARGNEWRMEEKERELAYQFFLKGGIDFDFQLERIELQRDPELAHLFESASERGGAAPTDILRLVAVGMEGFGKSTLLVS